TLIAFHVGNVRNLGLHFSSFLRLELYLLAKLYFVAPGTPPIRFQHRYLERLRIRAEGGDTTDWWRRDSIAYHIHKIDSLRLMNPSQRWVTGRPMAGRAAESPLSPKPGSTSP